MPVLPAMISRVAWLDCDKRAAAGCSHFVVRDQFAFHYCPVICGFNYTRNQMDWFIGRCWPQEFDCVVGRDGAGRVIKTVVSHQMVGGGPVAMAVEHGAGDASAEHSRKRLLVSFRLPVGHNFLAGWEAANVQPSFVCRATTKTPQVWGVSFLDTFFIHQLSPKSKSKALIVRGPSRRLKASTLAIRCPRKTDFGHWTLDVGLFSIFPAI